MSAPLQECQGTGLANSGGGSSHEGVLRLHGVGRSKKKRLLLKFITEK